MAGLVTFVTDRGSGRVFGQSLRRSADGCGGPPTRRR